MKYQYTIGKIDVVLRDDKIIFDENNAFIHQVLDDEEYTFDAIACAARPIKFSVVNKLYNLDNNQVEEACKLCNETKEIGVLTTNNYHLILSPFPEKLTYFGEKQAEELTSAVLEVCEELNVKTFRITQFCMMRGVMPYFDQFKGIINALDSSRNHTVKMVYFDIPDKEIYSLNILFKSYQESEKNI